MSCGGEQVRLAVSGRSTLAPLGEVGPQGEVIPAVVDGLRDVSSTCPTGPQGIVSTRTFLTTPTRTTTTVTTE